MIDILINSIDKTYFGNPVFTDVSLELKEGERVGLLGDNGTGKTTIFRMIAGEEKPDHGEISIRNGAKIGYFRQQAVNYGAQTVLGVLYEAFKELTSLQKEMEKLQNELEHGMNLEQNVQKLGVLQNKYEALNGYDTEEKLSKIKVGMKLEELLEQEYATLSGGEQMRVALAKLLLESPDILLLDEPTNHLDIDTLQWLEGYLKVYKGSVLIISHDRYFLDQVMQKAYEIKGGKTDVYYGNYSSYLEERKERYENQLKYYDVQQKKRKQLEDAAAQMRIWAKQADNEKLFKRAKAMEKRLDTMEKIDRPIEDTNHMRLSFGNDSKNVKWMLRILDYTVSIGERILVDKGELQIRAGERIGLIGANGCGKTTFIKSLMDSEALNPSARVGYLEQNITFETPGDTVINTLRHYHPMDETSLRRTLAAYEFRSEDVFKRIENLSGGECVRLMLCILVLSKVNFLMLDEPTNHIDIKTKEVLEQALLDFDGTILFISHDRYFLNKLADRIVEIRDQKLLSYVGNYEYYKREREKETKLLPNEKKENAVSEGIDKLQPAPKKPVSEKPKESLSDDLPKKLNPYKRKELEERLAKQEQEVDALKRALAATGSDYTQAVLISEQLKQAEALLEVTVDEYLVYVS